MMAGGIVWTEPGVWDWFSELVESIFKSTFQLYKNRLKVISVGSDDTSGAPCMRKALKKRLRVLLYVTF